MAGPDPETKWRYLYCANWRSNLDTTLLVTFLKFGVTITYKAGFFLWNDYKANKPLI